MITLKQVNDLVVECARTGCPTSYLMDAKGYAEIAKTHNEDSRWRLIKANRIATRTKKEA